MDHYELRSRLRLPASTPEPIRAAAHAVPLEAVGGPAGSEAMAGITEQALVPAAVLVPFVLGAQPSILLTKRTAHLSKHAGQVSFPGGRIDPTDPSPEAAALREAQEEVALDPRRVEVTGRLGDYVTGTGYRIIPVLGLLPAGVELEGLGLVPNPDEVESVFALPLSVLMDPRAPRRERTYLQDRWREYWVWPHEEHRIWGATAAILVHLAQRLRGDGE